MHAWPFILSIHNKPHIQSFLTLFHDTQVRGKHSKTSESDTRRYSTCWMTSSPSGVRFFTHHHFSSPFITFHEWWKLMKSNDEWWWVMRSDEKWKIAPHLARKSSNRWNAFSCHLLLTWECGLSCWCGYLHTSFPFDSALGWSWTCAEKIQATCSNFFETLNVLWTLNFVLKLLKIFWAKGSQKKLNVWCVFKIGVEMRVCKKKSYLACLGDNSCLQDIAETFWFDFCSFWPSF